MLNGEHANVYAYDPVSGRLVSVTDTVSEPDVVHSFVWNPEGTLARWSTPLGDNVYGYNEDGYLVLHTAGADRLIIQRNSDGKRVRETLARSGSSLDFYFVYSVGCVHPLRIYLRQGELLLWSIDLWDGFGQLVSRERKSYLIGEREERYIIGEGEERYIIWAHYGMREVLSITNASGTVLSSGSSREHCENLKDKLLSLIPDVTLCKIGDASFMFCPKPPVDCQEFNDTLYKFCYNCKAYIDFARDCDMLANWYYLHSGCKIPPFPPLHPPGRPFLPPVQPGDPVAPPPSPPRPIPICDGNCERPGITSPEAPRKPPCPECNPTGYFIWYYGIDNNPTSCAYRYSNGFRGGDMGHQLCLACCDIAAQFYDWSPGRRQDCYNACEMFNPGGWRR